MLIKIFLSIILFFSFQYTHASTGFVDIINSPYKDSINDLYSKGLISGFSDNTFRPKNTITRAEFIKIILLSKFDNIPESNKKCFNDIDPGFWTSKYICFAKRKNIVQGYKDNTYHPEQFVTIQEAMKMIVNTMGLEVHHIHDSILWSEPYLRSLSHKNAIPSTISDLKNNISREELVEMLVRILNNDTSKPSKKTSDFVQVDKYLDHSIPNVNINKVRQTWLSWINSERIKHGLDLVYFDKRLNNTALEWSLYSAEKGFHSHKREGQNVFYDYTRIYNWFKGQGIRFRNINKTTFSENIGGGVFKCEKTNCTDDLIIAIRKTFDGYMAEKNLDPKDPKTGIYGRAHYETITLPYFKIMGLGITVDNGTYYLTVHYGVEIY